MIRDKNDDDSVSVSTYSIANVANAKKIPDKTDLGSFAEQLLKIRNTEYIFLLEMKQS